MIENATDGCKTKRNGSNCHRRGLSIGSVNANIRQVLNTNQDGASEQSQESEIVERWCGE
jgi:hypothetical protein